MEGLEVFMRNLKPGLSDEGLRTQLTPFITDNLKVIEWTCQKTRGKKFGTVLFLYRSHGELFLQHYGEATLPGRSRTIARLHILGNPIFCSKSKHALDTFALRALKKAVEEIMEAKREQDEDEQPLTRDVSTTFELLGLSCGHYEYPDGRLGFAEDVGWDNKGLAKFGRYELIITLQSHVRVEIPYRTVHEVIVDKRATSFTFTLWEVPRFFDTTNDLTDPSLVSLIGQLDMAPRSNIPPRTRLDKLPRGRGENHADILGQSLIYCARVSPSDFHSRFEKLKKAKEQLAFVFYQFPYTGQYSRSDMVSEMISTQRLLDDCTTQGDIPFDVLFQFQALMQNGYLLPRTVQALVERLRRAVRTSSTADTRKGSKPPCPISARAVKKLFFQLDFPGPEIEASLFDPEHLWIYLQENEKEVREGLRKELVSERARQNLEMVYKVQVTPTRISLLGPEPEAKNRILRKFPNHTGYFARVQFCEEDGQDVFFNAKVSLDEVWKRFKRVLLRGIHIAGREYKFLGFSHSSLRAHGVWFMAPFVDHNWKLQTYKSVIGQLGTFDKIFSPPRCAARIGQAFSETPFSVNLEDLGVKVEFIPDVKSADGNRVFSDGVGTLSRSLMEAIQASLSQTRNNSTCFQIRWGGAKGMLALDDTLEGMVMRIRNESMVKFESKDITNLEICDTGNKPIPLVLNRQMIKILEDMNVAEDWFFQMQNGELDRLRMITAYVQNTIVFLKRQKIAEPINFSKFIRRLHKLKIDYRNDRFLCSIVETVVLEKVRLLKHKARIPVEKGVTLFGIMDEFGFLEEDEIYVTFDKKDRHSRSERELHNKNVLVTRSPALHPGDIQLRTAVLPPYWHPLRSLSNCVVFSQKGQRDLPSQLSGGDLDGDIYNIIWDEYAVASSTREFEPADYPRVNPLDIGRQVNEEDMTNFFVDFMATDQLGVIATKHLILSDMMDAGTVDKECKILAELHSTGVDYSKTGIPIDTNKLRKLTATRYRPDFLAPAPPAHIVDRTEVKFENTKKALVEDEDDERGPRYKFYKSEKVLGKLYRAIDENKIWKKDIHQSFSRHGPSVWKQLEMHISKQCQKLRGVNWSPGRPALDEACRIRMAYDEEVWSVAMDFSDNSTKGLSELEVFTGSIFNKTGSLTRRQRDNSIRLKDDYDRIARWAGGLIRKKKIEPQEDEDDDDSDYDEHENAKVPSNMPNSPDGLDGISALELSVACFMVSIEKPANFGRNQDTFQSFKIVAAQCALSELEIASMQQEIAEGAAFATASAK